MSIENIGKQPISNIQWISPDKLKANGYNPNVVLDKELQLLKLSLLKQGWLQAVLVNKRDMEIIDGYHRWWLCSNDEDVAKMTDGKVPVIYFDLDLAERMMLTIRINRAKGVHVAYRMSEIIHELKKMGKTDAEIAEGIGATLDEVKLLSMDDVFEKKNIKEYKYSKAWIPVKKKELENGQPETK